MLLLSLSHFLIRDLMKDIGNDYPSPLPMKSLMHKEVMCLIYPAVIEMENGRVRLELDFWVLT